MVGPVVTEIFDDHADSVVGFDESGLSPTLKLVSRVVN